MNFSSVYVFCLNLIYCSIYNTLIKCIFCLYLLVMRMTTCHIHLINFYQEYRKKIDLIKNLENDMQFNYVANQTFL